MNAVVISTLFVIPYGGICGEHENVPLKSPALGTGVAVPFEPTTVSTWRPGFLRAALSQ